MTPIGQAPAFGLYDQGGKLHRLPGDMGSRGVVLVFYPYDQSPVCRRQLCSYNLVLDSFLACGVPLWGINNADQESHAGFAQREHLKMPLLSDADFAVSRAYGCLYEMGPIRAIRRTVVWVQPGGKIGLYQRGNVALESILAAIGCPALHNQDKLPVS